MQMLSLGPKKSTGHQGLNACRMASLLLPVAISGDTGTSRFHDSSWPRLVRDPTSSYQERGVAERSSF